MFRNKSAKFGGGKIQFLHKIILRHSMFFLLVIPILVCYKIDKKQELLLGRQFETPGAHVTLKLTLIFFLNPTPVGPLINQILQTIKIGNSFCLLLYSKSHKVWALYVQEQLPFLVKACFKLFSLSSLYSFTSVRLGTAT